MVVHPFFPTSVYLVRLNTSSLVLNSNYHLNCAWFLIVLSYSYTVNFLYYEKKNDEFSSVDVLEIRQMQLHKTNR